MQHKHTYTLTRFAPVETLGERSNVWPEVEAAAVLLFYDFRVDCILSVAQKVHLGSLESWNHKHRIK